MRVRSLHPIDDEDFEDTREQAEIRKRLIEEAQQKAEEAKKNKNVPGMKATNRHEDEKADEDSADGKKD